MKETRWNMKPNKAKALMLAKRQLPEFVCDAVNLEGIPFTLPEIQTLLDAIASLASDAGCAIPDSMKLEMQEAARLGRH